jgi:hypothetical protein
VGLGRDRRLFDGSPAEELGHGERGFLGRCRLEVLARRESGCQAGEGRGWRSIRAGARARRRGAGPIARDRARRWARPTSRWSLLRFGGCRHELERRGRERRERGLNVDPDLDRGVWAARRASDGAENGSGSGSGAARNSCLTGSSARSGGGGWNVCSKLIG